MLSPSRYAFDGVAAEEWTGARARGELEKMFRGAYGEEFGMDRFERAFAETQKEDKASVEAMRVAYASLRGARIV